MKVGKIDILNVSCHIYGLTDLIA